METRYVEGASPLHPMKGGNVLQEARSRSASTLEDKTMLASKTLSVVGLSFHGSHVYDLNGQVKKTLESAEKLLAHEQTVAQLHGSKNARLSLDGKVERHPTLKLFFSTKPGRSSQTAMKDFITDTVQQILYNRRSPLERRKLLLKLILF